MKKITTIFIMLLFVFGHTFQMPIFAQNKIHLKLIGEIIAYDSFQTLTNITSAPKAQTFFIKVTKVLKGKETEQILIVRYNGWKLNDSLFKKLIGGENKLKLKIKRDKNCDSNLDKWQNKETDLKPDSRIVWLNEKDKILQNIKMPCYLLDDKGFSFTK